MTDWIKKAEGDFHLALVGSRQRKHPVYDQVCFLSQQCVEKYLKAFLVSHGLRARRTHDLDELCAECETIDPSFTLVRPVVAGLLLFAVHIRYPGLDADRADMKLALAGATTIRLAVRLKLGLPATAPKKRRQRRKKR